MERRINKINIWKSNKCLPAQKNYKAKSDGKIMTPPQASASDPGIKFRRRLNLKVTVMIPMLCSLVYKITDQEDATVT